MHALLNAEGMASANRDAAVSRYMTRLYLLMALGLAISAAAALLVASHAGLRGLLMTSSGLTAAGWAVMLAPLLLVVTISTGVHRISIARARTLFLIYAVLVGLSLGAVAYATTGESLAGTLLVTAGAFTVLALIGQASNAEISGLGAFLTLGIVGLVLLMALNLILGSHPLDLMLAAAGIVLFATLTAFDVQRLKRLFLEGDVRSSTVGALTLYLDFLNMFLSLLRFGGRARR